VFGALCAPIYVVWPPSDAHVMYSHSQSSRFRQLVCVCIRHETRELKITRSTLLKLATLYILAKEMFSQQRLLLRSKLFYLFSIDLHLR
jgi:hypothetical protein